MAERSLRTARDNARARALGYRDYYDFRVHDSGRIPPGVDVPRGQRSRARGHAGKADLLRTVKPGDVLVVPDGLGAVQKDRRGRFARIDLMVLGVDGKARRFTVRRQDYDQVVRLIDRLADKGSVFSPSPSLDLRRLVRVADRPDDGDAEPYERGEAAA